MKSTQLLAVFILQITAMAQQTSSLRLEITGDVAKPVVYEAAQWKQLKHISISATNLHDKKTATYSGVRLIDLLKEAGVPNGESLRSKALASCVLVTAVDGYQVVFSLAELDEGIGNEQVLVADAEDGRSLPGETGPLRLIVPADKRPARWVRMVKTIRVITNPTQMFHVEKAIRMAWEPIDCSKLVIDTETTLDSCVERARQYLTQISQQIR